MKKTNRMKKSKLSEKQWMERFPDIYYKTKLNNEKNMTYIVLNKNSFIRDFEGKGYIRSSLTHHDRLFDEMGFVFLNALSKAPKLYDDVIMSIYKQFVEVEFDLIKNDIIEFFNRLSQEKFVTIGSLDECINNQPEFSYSQNPKTITYDFTVAQELNYPEKDTNFELGEIFIQKPRIHDCQIEVTSKCNERCLHCYIPHDTFKPNDIDPALFYNVLDQLYEDCKTISLTLSGGECFLHPEINNFLKYARKKDFIITLLSNMACMTEEHFKIVKEVEVSQIQVSLYSMDETIHDYITQVKGSHKKTIRAIEKAISLDIPVQISCPTMRVNWAGYKDVMKWAHEHGIKAQTDFIIMGRSDNSIDNLANRLTIEETGLLINDIVKHSPNYAAHVNTIKELEKKDIPVNENRPVCGVGIDSIALAANGDLYPCSGWQSKVLGNANKDRLIDVWNNSPALNELRGLRMSSFKQCITCPDRSFCAMCLVRNSNESGGDMMKINKHYCKVANINKVVVEDFINSQIK